jgi:PAS domain-containing protein
LLGVGSFGAFAAAGLLLDATLPVVALLGVNLILLTERSYQEMRMRRSREAELAAALREAELRTEAENARESLAIALDAAQMGMWDADLITGNSRRSARLDEIFGYTAPPPEWGREMLLTRVVAEDRDRVSHSLDAAMQTGALHFHCQIRRPDGSVRSVVVDGRLYWADDGTPTRVAGVVADVRPVRWARSPSTKAVPLLRSPNRSLRSMLDRKPPFATSLQLSSPMWTWSLPALLRPRRGQRRPMSYIFRPDRVNSIRARGTTLRLRSLRRKVPPISISV